MHENSETIKGRDGQWYNVYDGTPFPLPQLFGFEKQPYKTLDEAENKAAWRSASGHSEDYAKQSPQYGFSNTYQPSPQAKALGKVIEVLEDPRNAWMGTGLAGGTIRGLGKLRGKLLQPSREAGGFREPIQSIKSATPDIVPENTLRGDLNNEPAWRKAYFETVDNVNHLASNLREASPEKIPALRDILMKLPPTIQDDVRKTYKGQGELQRFSRFEQPQLEGMPTPEMMRRFGFDGAQERAEIDKILRESRRSWMSEK